MGAALSIVILFTVSSTIVRVAGVFLEHTGIPRNVARLQAMSALSGTGFTTTESELILKTPERRRILAMLIITGSIGLASVVATLVVGFVGARETVHGVLFQAGAILVAFVFIRYVLFTDPFDQLVCGFAYGWLARHGIEQNSYSITYRIDPAIVVAEHHVQPALPAKLSDWNLPGLRLLGIRSPNASAPLQDWDGTPPGPDDVLLLLGPEDDHAHFANTFGLAIQQTGHS